MGVFIFNIRKKLKIRSILLKQLKGSRPFKILEMILSCDDMHVFDNSIIFAAREKKSERYKPLETTRHFDVDDDVLYACSRN